MQTNVEKRDESNGNVAMKYIVKKRNAVWSRNVVEKIAVVTKNAVVDSKIKK